MAVAAVAGCSTAPQRSSEATQTTTDATPGPASRVLLAYFSRAGENYHYGGRRDLAVGSTEVLARLISERLPVDTYRVEVADPYPSSYDAIVARNVREQAEGARPALAAPPPSAEDYDVVLLGSPIWNVGRP